MPNDPIVQSLDSEITATNESKRTVCGAPNFVVTRRQKTFEKTIGYIETKDIGTNLTQTAKSDQIKDRYLPSLRNFLLTDYIEFRWYVDGELRLARILAEEDSLGKFKATNECKSSVRELLREFLNQKPEGIKSAQELAQRMAAMARLLRDVIQQTLGREGRSGSLHDQLESFRKVLLHDLTTEQFADMYAQTISYGFFAARCHIDDINLCGKDAYAAFHGQDDKWKEFTREHAACLLPKTNPFLKKMFAHIAGPDLDDRITWIVDDLVTLLREAEMEVILKDFGKSTRRIDPVVHFYETFLSEYDPKLRETRGVYYTPEPVVSYIVRSVDILLKEKFGLARGLADHSKIKIPVGKETREYHRCLILDPATGTGTFLYEVIEQIYAKYSRQKGMWSGYVKEHLLPRLFGFELMMAPYTVAHMKLGLQLAETGYDFTSDERLRIFLTNTLQEAEEMSGLPLFAQWLAEEARQANDVKRNLPIIVILGNPPYSGISANQGKWINDLINVYREVDGQPLGEKKVWLKNDYIKFLRFAQWKIEQTGCGIIGFITDHSYLDSPTFRGMRQNLLKTFDAIYVLNLHGNSKRQEKAPDGSKDDNVFDITQGTVINLFVKCPGKKSDSNLFYSELWGSRKSKYETLSETDVVKTKWKKLDPCSPFYEFVPINRKEQARYNKGWKVTDILAIGSNGVQTSRDQLVIDLDKRTLKKRMEEFINPNIADSEIRNTYFKDKKVGDYSPGDTREWNLSEQRIFFRNVSNFSDDIVPFLYRPLDVQFILYHERMVDWPRTKVMNHLLMENKALCVGRAGLVYSGSWDLVFCSNQICDHNLFYRGSSMNFPLYLYPNGLKELFETSAWDAGKDGRIPNLAPEFIREVEEAVGLKFIGDGRGDLKKTFGPEDVFHYIYAVFHSPEYRRRYAEFLKIDFPRVPLSADKNLFVTMCGVGGQLCGLHLMEADILDNERRWPVFPVEGEREVEPGFPRYVAETDQPDKGKVYVNKAQYFEGVRPEVWEFYVGGYQVCEKWLKDRRGRKLSFEEINHYQKIVVALEETLRLMKESCLFNLFGNE